MATSKILMDARELIRAAADRRERPLAILVGLREQQHVLDALWPTLSPTNHDNPDGSCSLYGCRVIRSGYPSILQLVSVS